MKGSKWGKLIFLKKVQKLNPFFICSLFGSMSFAPEPTFRYIRVQSRPGSLQSNSSLIWAFNLNSGMRAPKPKLVQVPSSKLGLGLGTKWNQAKPNPFAFPKLYPFHIHTILHTSHPLPSRLQGGPRYFVHLQNLMLEHSNLQ